MLIDINLPEMLSRWHSLTAVKPLQVKGLLDLWTAFSRSITSSSGELTTHIQWIEWWNFSSTFTILLKATLNQQPSHQLCSMWCPFGASISESMTLLIKVQVCVSLKVTIKCLIFPSHHTKRPFLGVINIHQGIKLEGFSLLSMCECVFCFRRQPFMCVRASCMCVCMHSKKLPLEWIIYRRVSFAYVRSTGRGHVKFRYHRHRRHLSLALLRFPACPITPLQMLPPTSGLACLYKVC